MPQADVLYAADGTFWGMYRGVEKFRGLKLTQDTWAARHYRDVHLVELTRKRDEILVDRPGVIGDGGNSGFQALNIAVQFGAKKIVLVGFDMRLDAGIHWHGKHPPGLVNPGDNNLVRWRKALNGAASRLAELGVTVVNASPISALTAYPFQPLPVALSGDP